MSCRFLITEENTVSRLGPPSSPRRIHLCSLKLENEQQRFAIHQALHEKGIEERYITDNCPMVASDSWIDCPYYRKT